MPELRVFLIVCPLVFLAGFVDAIAGGGGLISLPAYLLVGLPVHVASGTNKVANCLGTLAATGKYLKSGQIRLRPAISSAVGALAGSAIGTRLAMHLPPEVFRWIILCAIPVAAVVICLKRDFGAEGKEKQLSRSVETLVCVLIGLGIGCYDGVVGPGTGTFMIMAFTAFLGMDLLHASGCAKVGNLASNAASAVLWLLGGKVLLALAIPAAACSMLGNYLGARSAVRGGVRRVRIMMYVVLALIFIKLLYDLLSAYLA